MPCPPVALPISANDGPTRAPSAAGPFGARTLSTQHGPLLSRVWGLRANLSAYDAMYVALAEGLRAPLRNLALAPTGRRTMAVQTGQLFGNYRMVRLLGEGGFGEVYLVENPLIGRRAAVKVLHTALAQDAELVRRFLNEARAASAIRHPNIIDVLDAGGTADGAPYILMEFLEGVSLQKRLADRGRLPLPDVLEIARQAGSALAAAHAAGIVHRDLKPENLFLVPDASAPGGEKVKVLDFGIAKIKHGSSTGGTVKTRTGIIMGSPAYMSPEQCKDSADVDLRDVKIATALLGIDMPTDPGRRHVVGKRGAEVVDQSVELGEGERKEAVLKFNAVLPSVALMAEVAVAPPPAIEQKTPTPIAVPALTETATHAPSDQSQRTWGWVAAGVGAAGLLTGAVTGIAVMSNSGLRNDCPKGACAASKSGSVDTYNLMRNISTVGFIVGGVGAAVGVTLLLWTPKGAAETRVAIWLGPSSAGVKGAF